MNDATRPKPTEPPPGVSWANWTAALALRPAHVAPAAWETACRAGAAIERMKETLAHRRRDALGRACYLAGADEWAARWEELPGSLREAYRAIACDPYVVSAITWSPAQQNIVLEYTPEEDTYQSVQSSTVPAKATEGSSARGAIQVDFGSPADATRRLLRGAM